MFGRGRTSNKDIQYILGLIWIQINLDPDLDPGSIFPLFHRSETGHFMLAIKYELRELRMNVNDMFWSGRPSDDERRWWRFELYVCFLVFSHY